MRHKSFILLASLLFLLIGGAVAVYAYDASNNDEIAKGITVAGVDVGGLKKAEAAKAVADRVNGPLQTTIKVRWAGKTYHLSAKRTHARANIDATIQEALDKSDSGNILSRTKRNLTGGRINTDIPVEVSYDEASVEKLVAKIEKRVDRRPVNAGIAFGGPQAKPFHTVEGKDGVQLDTDQLKQRLHDEVVHPTPKRLVKATVTHIKPKVTNKQLAKRYPTILAVDRESFQLRLYKDFKLKKTYTVAVGQQGLDTPAGLYHIQNKAVNPAWSVPHSAWTGSLAGKVIPGGAPNNPLKARWLGIFDGAGIHGVDPSEYGSLGHAASHGCVRMRIDDVIELYDQVPVGAPIYIS
jgi:lipoprotein-anchoring transpeptidase ErfK/SrfK